MADDKLTLVVLAAGLGRRFGGAKQIEAVGPNGEILLDYSVFDARRAGFSRIVFVVRKDVEDVLRTRFAATAAHGEIDYVTQRLEDLPPGNEVPVGRERPWGTGHAVWACRNAVAEPFAVVNADDFYGEPGFRAAADFLQSLRRRPEDPLAMALVGYALAATLTPHGAVSRGICRLDPGGRLAEIVERHGVERQATGIGYVDDGGGRHPLAGDAVASMNFWAFPAEAFPPLGREFARFLRASPGPEAEFGLPTAVGSLLGTGAADVRVLRTASPWLGVTHREDLAWVRSEIRRLVEAGVYPSPIWGTRERHG